MPLLNYSTKINVERTVTEIQKILAAHGAKSIQMDYVDGLPVGLAFFVATPIGERSFALPANAEGVLRVLTRRAAVPPRFATRQQAQRVAWRILKDWIAAQMAIIDAGMASLDQVMLPYMVTDDGPTLYEAFRDHELRLPAGQESA